MRDEDDTFDGDTFDPEKDYKRLRSQLDRVKFAMIDGQFLTLGEIAASTKSMAARFGLEVNDSEAGISARIRDLRKEKFGGAPYHVESRRRGDEKRGLWEYRWNKFAKESRNGQ